jgi:hypothetical protein
MSTRKNTTTKQPRKRRAVKTTEEENRAAAVKVNAFLEEPIPDFIRNAVAHAITQAAERTGAPAPEDDPKHAYGPKGLAYLFEVAWRLDLRAPGFAVTPRAALAEHIAAILQNPETPTPLYNAIADELCTLSEDYCQAVSETPAYIESCLDYYQRGEAKRTKGGKR